MTFDLDGTLADTLPVCYRAFRNVFVEHLGRELTDEEIHRTFGPSEEGVFQMLIPEWERAFSMYLAEYESAHELCTAPFAGIPEILDGLRSRGVRIAVVTGKGPKSAEISLRRLGLEDRFEIVEAGSPEGVSKAECIARILDAWDLPAGEAVHIGDAPSDIRSARTAGVKALAAAWAGTTRRESLAKEKPDALFTQVPQLAEWLAGACGA